MKNCPKIEFLASNDLTWNFNAWMQIFLPENPEIDTFLLFKFDCKWLIMTYM